jgi:mRNA-degrading endonuclease toxin of MazEF toxin-antitoxin module
LSSAVLTSNTAVARAPGNTTLLPKRRTGLPHDSVANASQVAAVNKADLDELIGTVPRGLMDAVDGGVRWFLDLD